MQKPTPVGASTMQCFQLSVDAAASIAAASQGCRVDRWHSTGTENISASLDMGVTENFDDTMYIYEEDGWRDWATGITQNVNGLWANAPDDVVGVGSDGLIVRKIGGAWASQPSLVTTHLRGVPAVPGRRGGVWPRSRPSAILVHGLLRESRVV